MSRKGQSAIEYLMTYGWMLLVVAIVGGAIFAFTQGRCTQSATASGGSFSVKAFGLDASGNLDIVFRNTEAERLTVREATILADDGNESFSFDRSIPVSGTGGISIPSARSTDGSNTVDLRARYDQGGREDITAEVTLTGQIQADMNKAAAAPSNAQAST